MAEFSDGSSAPPERWLAGSEVGYRPQRLFSSPAESADPDIGSQSIYGATFAAGEADSAKLQDVLAKLHETSLTQLVEDHAAGHLDGKSDRRHWTE